MIWSIMPEEVLFAAEPAPLPDVLQCSYLGRQLLLRPGADGAGEIVSLLSTDPADFIDPRLAVGRRIRIEKS